MFNSSKQFEVQNITSRTFISSDSVLFANESKVKPAADENGDEVSGKLSQTC